MIPKDGLPDSDINETHRRLSCIMFTDMVGYSALTQKNEMLAIELLQEQKHHLRPIFKKYNGKEIEVVGDAFFVEFESALEGVNCAVEIQKFLHERNLKLANDNKIVLRIGLHVGDVIHVGNRVHGDGVNIAARLEPLAKQGGICISEDVARQVHNKIQLPLEKQMVQKLKNISHKVEIFHVILPWDSPKSKIDHSESYNRLSKKILFYLGIFLFTIFIVIALINYFESDKANKNRIAILPLKNISNNSEDVYFADGLTEELISQLAKIGGLNVIAKTSVMKFQSDNLNLKEIGDELGVGSLLIGSVRTFGNNARISVQLVNVDNLENIWTENFDKELKDIFKVQSSIALKVANELKIKLLSEEKKLIEKEATLNPEAYRKYLLGLSNLNRRTVESIYSGLDFFKEAVRLDSNYAQAFVGMADCYTLISAAGYGYLSQKEASKLANKAINKALEIDYFLAEAYNTFGYIKLRLEWDWKNAEENFQRAIKLKPNFSKAHERYSLLLALLGRNDEALIHMKKAFELDPLSASVSTGLGRVYHFSGNYQDAINQFNLTLNLHPNYAEAEFALAVSDVQVKKYKDAITILNKLIDKYNNRYIYYSALGHAYAYAGEDNQALRIYNKLKKMSQHHEISALYFAVIDASLGKKSKAIDLLYEAYEKHFGILVYIKASQFYNKLRDESRFKKLQKLVGLI